MAVTPITTLGYGTHSSVYRLATLGFGAIDPTRIGAAPERVNVSLPGPRAVVVGFTGPQAVHVAPIGPRTVEVNDGQA